MNGAVAVVWSRWAAAVLIGAVVVAVIGLASFSRMHPSSGPVALPSGTASVDVGPRPTSSASATPRPTVSEQPTVEVDGTLSGLVPLLGGLLLLLAVAAAAPMVMRIGRGGSGRHEPTGDVASQLDFAIDRLAAGDLAHGVVADCWRAIEAEGARLGVRRRAEDTADEYAARLASVTHADPADLGALAALYERAVFDSGAADPVDGALALETLRRLRRGMVRR